MIHALKQVGGFCTLGMATIYGAKAITNMGDCLVTAINMAAPKGSQLGLISQIFSNGYFDLSLGTPIENASSSRKSSSFNIKDPTKQAIKYTLVSLGLLTVAYNLGSTQKVSDFGSSLFSKLNGFWGNS